MSTKNVCNDRMQKIKKKTHQNKLSPTYMNVIMTTLESLRQQNNNYVELYVL